MFELNNREISTAIWFFVLFLFLAVKDINNFLRSVANIIKSFLHIKILLPILLLWVYSIIVLLAVNNFFDISGVSIKNLAIWFLFTAIVLMFNLTNISRDRSFFKNIIIKNLFILAFFEYIFNLYSFNLIVEIILQFVIATSSLLIFVSSREKNGTSVKKLFSFLLIILMLIIIIKSIYGILNNFNGELLDDFFLNFIVPIVLTVFIIPFLYFMAIVMQYESLFLRLPYTLNQVYNKREIFGLKMRIVLHYGFNLNKIVNISNEDLSKYGKNG